MAMATFARQTGAFVIAEGVEDEDTLEFLRTVSWRDLSSDAVIQGGQGFGLGRPSQDPSSQWPAILGESDSRVASVMDARHATRA
jgi:EAL domain-containing protein (putative c-di-GMP-specific phosphodiesterase class I)